MKPYNQLGVHSNPVPLDTPKVHHIPQWGGYDDPKRLKVIRSIAESRGRDPRIATLVVQILKQANVEPRQYEAQSAALLKWVQDKIYYVNEPDERLQDPLYTLRVGYGDCDDMTILLGSMLESIRMPWKLVLSGVKNGQKVRYHEGEKFPRGVKWSHIYLTVGNRPFSPTKWIYAETTLRGAPFGWDVVAAEGAAIPEMDGLGGLGQTEASSMFFDWTQDWKIILRGVVIAATTAVLVEEWRYWRSKHREA